MTLHGCTREGEVFEAIRQGRWPEAVDPALREHVEGCGSCRDMALAASALQQSRRQFMAQANLAPPGVLFWKAQLQRRREDVDRMTRPIVVAETLAFILTLAALLIAAERWRQTFGAHSDATISLNTVSTALAGANAIPWTFLILVLAGFAAFAALAFYFLAVRE